ncbi:MAG: glycosyltransferase [Candidatus Latescibacteria bacterium]|nr:glycosyltransferase [Candidatus Latescibacterota bacterium]
MPQWAAVALTAVFAMAQGLLLAYSAHRFVTLWRWARRRRKPIRPEPIPAAWPRVTVQLPLYNERLVAERLIDSVAALDYPADLLEVQILDDSTDETVERAAAAAAKHRARGVNVAVLHRDGRAGYKAGALAAGLERAGGELIAIFDADFVPEPDFLKRVVPHFHDPDVGMVQARWSHLNRDRSLLTAAQAVMLDAHFFLEHEARMRSGLFFNFNGTAGVWRRSCIESSGGWTHDTLTEDLDLSYRAQLQGWRFVSLSGVGAPAELPIDVEAVKSQQRRWARGSIQTARKLLPAVLRSALPVRVKLEAVFHLTGNAAYPLLLLSGLLLLPVATAFPGTAPRLAAALNVGVIVTGVVPVCIFLVAGRIASGARGWQILRDLAAALLIGAGLSWNNTGAVLQGLRRRVGDWERTPKTGDGGRRSDFKPYSPARSPGGRAEVLLALGFAWMAAAAWRGGHAMSVPFLLLLFFGLGYVGIRSGGRSQLKGTPCA